MVKSALIATVALAIATSVSGGAYAQSGSSQVIDGCLRGQCRGGATSGSSSGSRFPDSKRVIPQYDYSNYGLQNNGNASRTRPR
jgi:hypothetical protein